MIFMKISEGKQTRQSHNTKVAFDMQDKRMGYDKIIISHI